MRSSYSPGRLLEAWQSDYTRQTMIGAALSLVTTAVFALYHGYLGLWYGSVWHGSIGAFYLLLAAIRGLVLLTEKRIRTRPTAEQAGCRQRTFLASSVLLLLLDLALMLPIAMMVMLDNPVSIGLIPAIAMAAYSVWKITMASIHIRRQKRKAGGNVLVSELRTVNFIDALVAILTLQNTLIMVNRTESGKNSMLPVSAASSAVIYVVIVTITVRMLWQGVKRR